MPDPAKCILCNKQPHDSRCPYVVVDGKSAAEIEDDERALYQERAAELYNNISSVDILLDTASLVGIQKLIKAALLPSGKDPAITSIRAISEIINLNNEWTKKKQAKEGAVPGGKNTRSRLQ